MLTCSYEAEVYFINDATRQFLTAHKFILSCRNV